MDKFTLDLSANGQSTWCLVNSEDDGRHCGFGADIIYRKYYINFLLSNCTCP